MLKNIEADHASAILRDLPAAHTTEDVALSEALGRVLAEDVVATVAVPPFDRSPYDGYALRGEDTSSASKSQPVTLRVIEEIPAGYMPSQPVASGTAAKILTGAPLPDGANATVKYEITKFTDETVTLFEPVTPNTDVVRAGDDIALGERIAEAGTVVTAAHLGVFATQGRATVTVYKKPKILILNTGTELVEVGQPLGGAQIYNSNVYTLGGYLAELGAEAVNAGTVEDDPDIIAARIGAALEEADMVVTTGGASVGDYDWAVTSAEKLGADVLFWKTNMKPGGSLMAAVKDGKLLLGLSGNPGAAVLGLWRIAMPYVRKLCGYKALDLPSVQVRLKAPLYKSSPKLRLLRGRLEISPSGEALFAETEGQGNGAVFSLVGCDLLGEIPSGSPPLEAGTPIKAYRL